ncbi:MAG: sensor histidine kinase [Saprospiraceae bacterium]
MKKYIEPAIHLLFWIFITVNYFQNSVNNVRIVREVERQQSDSPLLADSTIVTVNYVGETVDLKREIALDSTLVTSNPPDFKDIIISNYQHNKHLEIIRFYDQQITTLLTAGNLFKALLFYGIAFWLIPNWLARQKWWTFIALLLFFILFLFSLEMLINFIYLQYRGQVIYPDGVQPDNFRQLLNINIRLYPLFLVSAFTYRFAKDWIHNQNVKKILTEEKLITELKFLKAQIHPHFLFNTLNNLYGMALADKSERTAEGIAKLARQMRYMLYESNVELIDLEKEIAYIQTFISLQQLRLTDEDEVKIEFQQSGDLKNRQIAPMLLIPFVENAFKHGITFSEPTEIMIKLEVNNDNILIFNVKNTIKPRSMQQAESASGLGLQNVKRRLELLYPDRHELNIDQQEAYFYINLKLII